MKRHTSIKLLSFAVGMAVLVAAYYVMKDGDGLKSQQASDNGGGAEGSRQARKSAEPLKTPLPDPKIIVVKADRTLTLYSGEKAVRKYRVGLGFSPEGHKIREGDGRTPEGTYYICNKNPESRYHLSLGVSYPNEKDAERGQKEGLITQSQYQEIMDAQRNRSRPPWDTPLGGEIFIHGHGAHSDWTLGCIALEDEDIEELYNAVEVGTPVLVLP
jgi:murein L,D-transpeptidase YafK